MARPKTLLAEDVMTRDLIILDVRSTIEVAAKILAERHISGAPIVSPTGKPVGMITRADLLDPRHDRGATLDVAMTRVLYGVRRTDPVMAAVRLMKAEQIHRVVVVDEGGHLVGLITSMDIVRLVAETEPEAGAPVDWVPIQR